MTAIRVTYRKHFNEIGEGDDHPTDELQLGDLQLQNFEYGDNNFTGEAFPCYGRENWVYEVDDEDVEQFETILQRTESVLDWAFV